MTKLELINYLKTDNKSGSKTRENHFIKRFPQHHILIKLITFTSNWNEQLYCYLHDLNDTPKCKNCDNYVSFRKVSKGYYQYCSVQCRNTDPILIEIIKTNFFKKHGVNNPMKISNNVDKVKHTKKLRYGDENYVNPIKGKRTKKLRYGDENYNNREKANYTREILYNNAGYTNRPKAIKTNLEYHGVKHYNNRPKAIKTNLEYHGVKHYNNRPKAIKTNLERYGVSSFTQTNEYKISCFEQTRKKYANKLNINFNNLVYDGENVLIKNYCKIHNEFIINKDLLKNRILYGIENICTICNPINKHTSIKEQEIFNYIKSLKIDLIINDRKLLNGKEIDIYLPDYKLGIEFNGLYYHSDNFLSNDYHLNKTIECEKQGIQLLHIFEDEWIYKKEIIKSIIKSKLGLIDNKIYARKTEVREISNNKLIREFLNKNHIQGFVGSKIKLGLFYNDKLVSIMTFGKKRITMGNKQNNSGDYEMLRFCNKLNTTVIGGASKLLKYFIINSNPNEIITYADRRYSSTSNNLYKTLGFSKISISKPNYWYFKTHEYVRHYRFNFRKDVLIKEGFDPNKTEKEIMVERKYYRIYDCGNIKYSTIF